MHPKMAKNGTWIADCGLAQRLLSAQYSQCCVQSERLRKNRFVVCTFLKIRVRSMYCIGGGARNDRSGPKFHSHMRSSLNVCCATVRADYPKDTAVIVDKKEPLIFVTGSASKYSARCA